MAEKGAGELRGNIGKYQIRVENEHFRSRVFWARVVGSERENLLTQVTRHTFYEVQYALEGKIGMELDGPARITVNESEFIIIPPDCAHQVTDADSTGARFIIAFSLEARSPEFAALLSQKGAMEPHLCRASEEMHTLLRMILEKNHTEGTFRVGIITELVHAMLMEILSLYLPALPAAEEISPAPDENGRRVGEILRVIRMKNGVGVDVSGLAKRFGLSERHLSRLFAEYAGESVSEAICREKVKYMENLIVTTSLSFREISELCGYSDEYAMNKFFKKYNHLTPREYRRIADAKK